MLAGGNAIDAAIGATAAQGVVAPETCGIGGDLFALVHRPGWDRPRAMNASGRAGSNADPDSLRSIGHTEIPRDHPLTVTVPGCVDGWAALSTELGALSLADCLQPAIECAGEGFEVSTEQARAFGDTASMYANHPAVREFYPDGEPVAPGQVVIRTALAGTLRAIAGGGRDAFYRGDPADEIVAALGGTVNHDDLAAPHADWVTPIGCTVAGLAAWTIPPNSQGYLGPASLAVFEMLDPPDNPDQPDWWHLLIEAYRSVAWERDDLVADPDSAPLPVDLLLDPARLRRVAMTIDRDRTGIWPRKMGRESGTAYLCVVDSEGMAVSMIQSNYYGTGSAFGVPRGGFLLHNRGAGFTLAPGHPNELRPNKRPLHTLSPTIWTEQDRPRWVIGTRGGSLQPQLVAQVAARAIISGHDLESTQAAPRWTISDIGPYSTPLSAIEPGLPRSTLDELRRRGHQIEELAAMQAGWGPASIIEVDGENLRAAADPRVDTTAALIF
ncbi:MAG TPA: gamma-glutamyltransferase [Acidimicrobiia bacterium]|nr:gamma-glutamyltransferase [Acidimicrobiia bacterium]